jgi:hypothetical protein
MKVDVDMANLRKRVVRCPVSPQQMYWVESSGSLRARIPLRTQSVVERFGTVCDHEHAVPTQGLPVSHLMRGLRLGRS